MDNNAQTKELFSLWFEFLEQDISQRTVERFSKWLPQRLTGKENAHSNGEQYPDNVRMEFGRHLGAIINFTDYWSKLAFKDLPIRHFEDLAILREVDSRRSPTKNDLAELLVDQKSTVYEMIKRLSKNGLLSEEKDTIDKRKTRISLSKKGKNVLKISEMQAAKVAKVLTGNLDMESLAYMSSKLKQLSEFHQELHDFKKYDGIDEVLET